MDQIGMNLKCPVCGAARQSDEQIDCAECGFRGAFVAHFADAEQYAAWRESIAMATKRPIAELQSMMAGSLILGGNCVGVHLKDGSLHLANGIYREAETRTDTLQVSFGERHTVTLRANGTVAAEGDNTCGQRNVSALNGIRAVLAAPNCTYAVRSDGRVAVCGLTGALTLPTEQLPGEPCPVLKDWNNVVRLACGNEHLVGLTADGRVLIGGFSPTEQEIRSAEAAKLRDVKEIAAAVSGGTIALLKDGTAQFLGAGDDPRAQVQEWKDLTAVAMESGYSVGLTSDGRVRLAGSVNRLLDLGRSQAAAWENVVAIACRDAVIAAVTDEGELKLAGTLARKAEVLEVWDREIRPVLHRWFHQSAKTDEG